MLIICVAETTKKSILIIRAAFRNLFLFIMRFVKPYLEEVSSSVIKRMIAPTANNRLRSEKVTIGICIASPRAVGILYVLSWFLGL